MENIDRRPEYRTNKDQNIFYKVLTRSTYPISHDVFDIQEIADKEKHECEYCSDMDKENINNADFRIIKRKSKPYTKYICMECIQKQTRKWLDKRIKETQNQLDRYKVAEKL